MTPYRVEQIITLRGGVVGLSNEEQLRRRAHVLAPHVDDDGKPVDGLFVVNAPTQFKVGEIIGLDEAGIGKALLGSLVEVDKDGKPVVKKAAKKKAD